MKISIQLKNVESTFKQLFSDARKDLQKQALPVATSLKEELAVRTPVDTGLAQASWKIAETEKGYDISNEVPYIEYLNAGSSQQAPEFFVEKTALKYGTPQGAIVET
jgi:hypothetical protein